MAAMTRVGIPFKRRGLFALLLCALGAYVGAFPTAALAEARKLALVVGNDAYENQPALAKAVGDAHAMKATLERLGFEVRMAENLDYAGMVDAIADFQSSIDPGDTVAFHFSGHGVAANGRNFLLPVDFPQPASGRQGEAILPRLAFDAGEIVDGLRAQGAALTLAVFDACRDNALTAGTRSVGLSRGLVRMDPPRGVFVMFSAGPGELAADRLDDSDPEPTSVFTRVFIPILETPGLTLVEIAKRTQVKVSELAATVDHQQFPDYSDRVIGDVVLLPKPDAPSAPALESSSPQIAAIEPEVIVPGVLPAPANGAASEAPPSSSDPDVALCDEFAGDPYDQDLPAAVDRKKLYDLERILDVAAAHSMQLSGTSYDPADPLVLADMPGAMVACDLALNRHPDEKRLAYQRTRATCLSGRADLCPGAIGKLGELGHAAAFKFAAFAGLSRVDDRTIGSGLAGMLNSTALDEWFGFPEAAIDGLYDASRGLLGTAAKGGDPEAQGLLPLLELSEDRDALFAELLTAGKAGKPIGIAALAFASKDPSKLSDEGRELVDISISNGSNIARFALMGEFRNGNQTAESFRKAREVLEPAVAAGSLVARAALRQVEADEAAAASGTDPQSALPAPEANTAPATPSPAPQQDASAIDFGDDASKWAKDGECDDKRFSGAGMSSTTLIDSDIGHDATDCREAYEAGKLAWGTDLIPPLATGPEPPAASGDVDFGDDASQWAKDGECDDSRFAGPGMSSTTLIESDIGHDATDCRSAYEAGKITLRGSSSASLQSGSDQVAFGDDASDWANNGLCDDRRFEGAGMTDTTLIESDIGHDATDCRKAYDEGRLSLR